MPKRSRSSSYVGRGKMVVVKRRKLTRRYGRRYRRFLRRNVFGGLEKHQNIYPFNDTVTSGGSFHTAIRTWSDGQAFVSDSVTQKTRDGNRIQPVSLRINGVITLADTTNIVRIILVQTRTVYSGTSDLLQAYPSSGIIDVWSSFNRLNMGSKYKIIYDRRFMLNAAHPQRMFNWVCPKRFLKQVHYNGTTLNDYTKNMIIMFMISDSAAVPMPTFVGTINLIHTNI